MALRLTGSAADAEDLLQEAALKALRGRASFEMGTNFRGWFYRIVVNHFYSTRRRERRIRALSLDGEPHHGLANLVEVLRGPPDFDPLTRLLGQMDAEEIGASLRALPPPYDVVALLAFGQEMSYQEIATILDIPVGTVRSRLHRARMLLRKRLRRLAQSMGLAASLRSPLAGLRWGGPCRTVIARLGEYLDGELRADDCGIIESHLAGCEPCQESVAQQRIYETTLRSRLGLLPCPPDVRERIMGYLMAAMGQVPEQ